MKINQLVEIILIHCDGRKMATTLQQSQGVYRYAQVKAKLASYLIAVIMEVAC